jgi:hypothetical protein
MFAKCWPSACAAAITLVFASATIAGPYVPVMLPPFATPAVGPGVTSPAEVFGKEYSREVDEDFMGTADPERVVAWDGLGGTLDGLDYTGSRPVDVPRERQVDALANRLDALYDETLEDRSHLVFSHSNVVGVYGPAGAGFVGFLPAVPMVGPVTLSNGNVINGAAEISVEESGVFAGAAVQHGWTTAPLINGMAPVADLDGLELWGPEPGTSADSNRYSLDVDVIDGGGVSVWSYDSGSGISSPYIFHGMIVGAVTSLLGAVPTTAFGPTGLPSFEAINVDALMVQDRDGVELQFGGPGDSIIFSINQIVDPADPDGYYATGSELFVLDATAAGLSASFLRHGGHTWDHAYALSDLGIPGLPNGQRAYIDIDGIEAVGELVVSSVPEPGSVTIVGIAFALTIVGLRGRSHH